MASLETGLSEIEAAFQKFGLSLPAAGDDDVAATEQTTRQNDTKDVETDETSDRSATQTERSPRDEAVINDGHSAIDEGIVCNVLMKNMYDEFIQTIKNAV